MQFTRLRLAGFKSFVDPVDLEIAPGMTGIVGPNGCGKSNLVEALRWVMGENSPRRMRGGDMEDVIFGGTASRPGRNIAEVTLVIDDTGALPLGIVRLPGRGEIEIARRIERGQGSDYRISGRPARARDVQTLFADAASGAHSPALVSQGRVSGLINAKPTERRQVLEDAAGIAGLHARRHEAELKLRAAEVNLERLDDILGAMRTQLGGLKKQARQAIRYREISEDIRKADAVLLVLRWQVSISRDSAARAAFSAADGAVRQAMRDATEATTRNTECAAALPPLRKEEAACVQALSSVQGRRDALVAEERQLLTATAESERQARQLASDREHEDLRQAEALTVETQLALEAQALAAHDLAHPDRVRSARRDLEDAQRLVDETDAAVAKLTVSVATAEAEAVALGRHKRDLDQRLATLDRRIAEENRRLGSLPADAADIQAIAVAADALAVAEANAEAALSALALAEVSRFDSESGIAEARSQERQAADEATRLVAEQRALAGLLKNGAAGNFPPVLDTIRVASGYETALAIALSDSLEAALDDAAPAYWRTAQGVREAAALPDEAAPLAPRIAAPAVLSWALAHVGIVPDDATGARLASSLQPGQVLVTRAGGLWRWDGLTRRPGAISAAASRLEQRNRLELVERELASAAESASAAAEALVSAERALAGASAIERQARGAVMTATSALERARADHAQRRRDAEARSATRRALSVSLANAEADRAGVTSSLSVSQDALLALPDSASAKRDLDALHARLALERNRLSAAQAAIEQLVREERARAARMAAIAAERREWSQRAARASTRLAELDGRRAALSAARATLASQPARLAAEREQVLSDLEIAEKRRANAADRVAAAEAAQQAQERASRQSEAALADARERRVRAEAAVAAVLEEIQQLKLRIVDRLGDIDAGAIDPPMLAGLAGLTIDALPQPDAAEARHAKLVRERESIGAVNLRAEIEVAELDQEILRMTAERDDLIAAIARLRQAVHGLNREARERLLASFGTIDAHFRRLFAQLFGGGAAELKLTDADDPLEAGLEILASPPGKKLQHLSLLSGGEQALTAIALIFAMFLTNPSPVCVLDEVDAPLDDANVDRFCLLVREIAHSVGTRFLIITHHRLTMARMDRLYGVTMAERGVSQLVSVDLRRADQLTAAE